MSKLEIKIAIGLACGGAAVPIILYLVPPKSPLLALALLVALFLFLLYPAWVFCWSEKHRWLRIAAIIILAVGVVAFGAYVWPSSEAIAQPSSMERLTQWVAQYVAYIRGMPWLWIASSLAIGAGVAVRLGSVIHKRRRLVENAKPKVKILTPLNDRNVGWREMVRGSVSAPESDVQVLVEFPDGWWHLQPPVEVRGYSWSCRCEFGETGKYGHAYDVIALLGTSLKAPKYEHLPENVVRSNVITVKRNSNEEFIDCPDVQLHQTRINDKNMITDLVKVCRIGCNLHVDPTEGDDRQYVDFDFWFLNLSLVPVSIESINGAITFMKETSSDAIPLDWELKLENNSGALNRPFRADGRFRLRQFLAPYDVTTVASGSDQSRFYFHNLNIMITGDGVAGVRLAIPDFVWKGKPWIANAECDFVFSSIAEAEAKIRDLETVNESLMSELDHGTDKAEKE